MSVNLCSFGVIVSPLDMGGTRRNPKEPQIEVLKGGQTRWYFGFWNRSDQTKGLLINLDTSYLADKMGNHYAVLTNMYGNRPAFSKYSETHVNTLETKFS